MGVDIQIIKQWRPSLPRRVCSQNELKWLEEQSDLWSAFCQLWALKESRVKQSGQGLTTPIPTIRIPLPQPEPVQMDELWFRSYNGPGWAAAVCGLSRPPEHIIWTPLPRC